MFLAKYVLKTCSKFTGEHPCQSVVSIKLHSNFIEVTLWHGCSPVNLVHISRTIFYKNTYGELLLEAIYVFMFRICNEAKQKSSNKNGQSYLCENHQS